MKEKRIVIIILLLMLFSVANNYYAKFLLSSYENYFIKQLLWYILGFIILFGISKINLNIIFKYSFYLYLLGNLLLFLTLLIGKNVNGSRAWISIFGFSIQPSEFMKIFLILYLREFTLKYNLGDFKYIIFSFLIVLVPSVLTFLEPDTGGVLIYLIIWLSFLILKGLNKWYYIVSIVSGLFFTFTFLLLYYQFQNIFIRIFGSSFFYRMDRITNFLSGEGYQISRALTSISNSGLFGISSKVYFPESATDFALTLFIGNFGIIGLVVLLLVYTLLFYELLKFNKDKYLLYPLVFILLFQFVVNTLMNIGLFPIIGITLPFLSYGGSSLLSYLILMGILVKKKASI